MSKRRPRRSVSSAITSSVPMLPRFTLAPTRRSSHACCERCGASKITVSWPDRARGSRPRARRAPRPPASNRPTVPLSRPSAITSAAPAARSREHLGAPVAGHGLDAALAAHLGDHRELAGELGDQLRLARARQRQRAVGDLDVVDPQLAQPLDVALHAPLVDGDLQQRPARADGDAGVAADRDLVGHGAADVRGAPAELDHVDVLAGGDQQRLQRERRQPAVHDVRDARPARLGRCGPAGRGTPASCGAGREVARRRRVAACDRPWRATHPNRARASSYRGSAGITVHSRVTPRAAPGPA